MSANCVGFYYIKKSASHKKEKKWIKANLQIHANINRYILELTPILIDDDIYDEDEDERIQRLPSKIKLTDYKFCESRGSQAYNNITIHLLLLIPKLFSKAKKVILAFLSEDVLQQWHKNLETILTQKFNSSASINLSPPANNAISIGSLKEFMIENDVYEGSQPQDNYIATVIENEKSKEISLAGRYILLVTDIGIELQNEFSEEVEKFWEMNSIRRFGEHDNELFIELGKHKNDDGQGVLCFKVNKGKEIMKELLNTKNNYLKNITNRKSMAAPKVSSEIRNNQISVYNAAQNQLYGTDPEDIQKLMKRTTSLKPPKSAPPPVPSDFHTPIPNFGNDHQ